MTTIATRLRTFLPALSHWRGLRLAAPLLLVGLLPGCWMSNEPLIGTEDASPVPFEASYKPEKDDVIVTVTANDDGSYSLIDNNGKGFTAFFLEVPGGWYVVQQDFKEVASESEPKAGEEESEAKPEAADGKGPYLYNLMHFVGRDILFYMPDCDEGTSSTEGVSVEEQTQEVIKTCKFESVAALERAAPKFIKRIEAGEIKDEPGILKAVDGKGD